MSGYIICGDSRLVEMPRSDLVITSPPYNVGIDYDEHEDEMSPSQWDHLIGVALGAAWKNLTPGGRMCVNVHHSSGRSPAFPLGYKLQTILENLPGSLSRGEIVWDKNTGAGPSTAWGTWQSPLNPVLRGEYEMIYVYSKGRLDLVPPYPECQSDISRAEFLEATKDVWRNFGGEKITENHSNHPAPFPAGLARRLMQLYSWPGQTVLDPFFGSGTVGLVAEATGRSWVGVELSMDYCKAAAKRIAPFEGMGPRIEDYR